MKRAMITGVTGQDGTYLAQLLLGKGYEVHGVKRSDSFFDHQRTGGLFPDSLESKSNFVLHHCDLTDSSRVKQVVKEIEPDEIYNLASLSNVDSSFEDPENAADVDGLGALRLLEAIRAAKRCDRTKIYQASTPELYGLSKAKPLNERTPFYPRSPYGVAKLYAYWITVNYREAYSMFACNGILFNHESPLRGLTFVSRKITHAVTAIALGIQEVLYLGNMNAVRDWGHARDYVEAAYLILQQDQPDDYVIATGVTNTVRDFAIKTFNEVGIQIEFRGVGLNEVGYVTGCEYAEFQVPIGKEVIRVDQSQFRPTDIEFLFGDSTESRSKLRWAPKYNFDMLIKEMVWADIQRHRKVLIGMQKGDIIHKYGD